MCHSTPLLFLIFFFFSLRSWYGGAPGDGGSGGSYRRAALGQAAPRCQPLYWTHWDGPTHHKSQQSHCALRQWREHTGVFPRVGVIPREVLPGWLFFLHCLMFSCQWSHVGRAVSLYQVLFIRYKHNWIVVLSSCAGYCILRAAIQNIWGDHRHCSWQLLGQVRSSYKGVCHNGPQ